MTQIEEILRHLQEQGSITSMEAIYEYGATRLSGIIYCLKKKGYRIRTENVTRVNRYGRNVTFGKYIYEGEIKSSSDDRIQAQIEFDKKWRNKQ